MRKKREICLATEAQEQEALIRWAKMVEIGKYLFAIPNGGLRDKITAARLKRQGVKPGVCDLFLAYPSNGSHGLFLEMKRKGGKLTKAQKDFMLQCWNLGYEVKVAYGWEEAKAIITAYLEKPKPKADNRKIFTSLSEYIDSIESPAKSKILLFKKNPI